MSSALTSARTLSSFPVQRPWNSADFLDDVQMADLVKDHGMSLDEVLGKGRKGKGTVAPKYRDPKNPENTWTGRGRMPLWMVAATKGSKVKKDDFLI